MENLVVDGHWSICGGIEQRIYGDNEELAQDQKLYLIIASSDYIYGTNYQFCHGYLGKEFVGLSEKKSYKPWEGLEEETINWIIQ